MFRDSNCVPHIHAGPHQHQQHLQETTALRAVKEWSTARASMLVLAGDVGTGKSLAAAWACYDWLVRTATKNPWGQTVTREERIWIAAPHLARLKPWCDEVKECEAAGFLVIDDMGEEEGTSSSMPMLASLVTTRLSYGRPTIITTNLDGATFRERYGERLIDRLRQSGLNEEGKAKWWIRCVGESLRGKVSPGMKAQLCDDDESVVERLRRLKAVGAIDDNDNGRPTGPQGE